MLLASRDLLSLQASAAGRLLDFADVRHEVITRESRLARIRVGQDSRTHRQRTAAAPVIRLPAGTPSRVPGAKAAAILVFSLSAVAGMAAARRIPAPVKGVLLMILLIACISAGYSAWWSPLPPLEVTNLLVDWRTSSLVPMVAISLLYAYDLYPLPGNFVLKTGWLGAALAMTAVFSTVRLAVVAAGYARYGAGSFLALHQLAGSFLDLIPGLALLAPAHATVSLSSRFGLRLPGRPR